MSEAERTQGGGDAIPGGSIHRNRIDVVSRNWIALPMSILTGPALG